MDEFCGLAARADVDTEIQATERNLAAAREQDPVRNTPVFEVLALPAFDVAAVERVLEEDLPSLDAAAAARVQEHVAGLGPGGETWIDEGMRRRPSAPDAAATCPFCAQDLAGSPVIDHYRAYFSAAYAGLKHRISDSLIQVNRVRGSDLAATLERALRVAGERRQFWSRFCDVPEISVDTETIARDWRVAHEAVVAALNAKQAAPLDRMTLAPEARAAGAAYEAHRETIAGLNNALRGANEAIRLVKEQQRSGILERSPPTSRDSTP